MFDSIFTKDFPLEYYVRQALNEGYSFASDAIKQDVCRALELEVETLPLEAGDHVIKPINPGTIREIKQLHARHYCAIGDASVPVTTHFNRILVDNVISLVPELKDWLPNEVGYQRYRSSDDYISPHRDRRNDRLFSATITINGSARLKLYEPKGLADDYSNLKLIDEFNTTGGSIMFLRAPGMGEQVIHEVLPPEKGSRLILNLRMRPDILKNPSEMK